MNREKSYRRARARRLRRKNKKSFVLLTALIVLLAALAVAGTIAYLISKPGKVVNTFVPGEVPNEVVENFENNVKKNVQIKNDGNVDAYIRAEVVVTWAEVDDNGDYTGNVYGTVPEMGVDYEWYPDGDSAENGNIGKIGEGWIKGDDGRYYYTKRVESGESTNILFTNCKPLVSEDTGKTPNQPEGNYVLSVEIMGQSIQADGMSGNGTDKQPVVFCEWGTAKGGSVLAVDSDKTLHIQSGNN